MEQESSVFDQLDKLDKPNGSFQWLPPRPDFVLSKENILMQGILQEIEDKTATIYEKKTYVATPTCLLRYPTIKIDFPEAVLELPFPRMEVFKDKNVWKYGIELTAHEITIKFAASSEEEAKKWYSVLKLRAMVVVTHFSSKIIVGRLLSRGPYSKLHVVTSIADSKQCASKSILKKRLANSTRSLKNMANEIRITRQLDHPNILKVFEVYESEMYVHIVTEYVKGKILLEQMQTKGSYNEADVVDIMREILEALSYLHSHSIIHRDIKPDNILVYESAGKQKIKLCNYKLANRILAGRLETFSCGTPGYVAPEVIRRIGYNNKADIFSAGIVMYSLLTGTSPFAAKTTEEMLEKNRLGEIDFKMEQWKKISPEALDLVVKMTNTDQYERPTATECLKHSWFSKKFGVLGILNFALSNIQQIDDRIENLSQRGTNDGVEGLYRVSPLFSGRHASHTTIPTEIPTEIPKHLDFPRSSNNVLTSLLKYQINNRKRKTDTSIINPFTETLAPSNSYCSPENVEDDIFFPLKSISTLQDEHKCLTPVSASTHLSFVPESGEERKLPDAPGSGKISKRNLNNNKPSPFALSNLIQMTNDTRKPETKLHEDISNNKLQKGTSCTKNPFFAVSTESIDTEQEEGSPSCSPELIQKLRDIKEAQ